MRFFRPKNILRSLRREDRRAEQSADDALEPAIRLRADRSRSASPDTEAQWLRLQRALAQDPAPVPYARRVPFIRYAIAGSAAVLLVAAVATLYLFRTGSAPAQFTTGRGERSTVILPDSSEVTLNYSSSISFDRTGFREKRLVTLAGEAYFKVRKNGAPFIVATNLTTVRVVGTEFNVRVRDIHYEVGVNQGIVEVRPYGAPSDSIRLLKGWMVSGDGRQTPSAAGRIVNSTYPGWMTGRIVFSGARLDSVCSEVGNRFDVQIRIADHTVRDLRVSGILNEDNPQRTIAALCALSGAHVRYADSSYILY